MKAPHGPQASEEKGGRFPEFRRRAAESARECARRAARRATRDFDVVAFWIHFWARRDGTRHVSPQRPAEKLPAWVRAGQWRTIRSVAKRSH